MADPSEAAKRIQSIVNTLEQKKSDVNRAHAAMNSLKMTLEQAENGLEQTRKQLVKELEKLDPEYFGNVIQMPALETLRPGQTVPASRVKA